MKKKQTLKIALLAGFLMTSLSLSFASPTYAVTKAQFKDAVCSKLQGPGATKTCREAIEKNGQYKLGTSGKTIKLADWRDSTKAELEEAMTLGVTTPADATKAKKEKEESDKVDASKQCGGAETAIIRCTADNKGGIETNGVWYLLLMTINILTAGIGIAAVGGIIYGSILYTSAGDSESQIKKAKEIIQNVIIGLIAYVAMYALLQFIIPGGVFS